MPEGPGEPREPEAIAALATRLPRGLRERWLLVFDFDGTLAAIAPSPDEAVLDPRLVEVLEPLRPLVGWLAVISGRDRESLRHLLPPGWLAVGSYGLQLPRELEPLGHPPGFDSLRARAALDAAVPRLEEVSQRWPGSRVEVKRWGLALHFRGMAQPPDSDEARRTLATAGAGHGADAGRRAPSLRAPPLSPVRQGLGAQLPAPAPSSISGDVRGRRRGRHPGLGGAARCLQRDLNPGPGRGLRRDAPRLLRHLRRHPPQPGGARHVLRAPFELAPQVGG